MCYLKSKGHKLWIVTKKGLQNKHKNLENITYSILSLDRLTITKESKKNSMTIINVGLLF